MKLSVIGLGHTGLPLSLLLARKFDVVGFETNLEKVNDINRGKSPIEEPGLEQLLKEALDSGKFKASSNEEDLLDTTVKIIAVGTPYDRMNNLPDYSQFKSSLEIVTRNIHKGDLIILKSTVPPGTTSRVVKGYINKAGLEVPKHIGLVYSPERAIEGHVIHDFQTLPKIIGASDVSSYMMARDILCSGGCSAIRVSSLETAEMIKLVDNYRRYVELGVTNEIALMSERVGVDVMELLQAAKLNDSEDSSLLTPGPGAGGSCLNKDPFILQSFMSSKDLQLNMVESAKKVNYSMPHHIVEITKSFGCCRDSVLIAGLPFKGDTDDTRFSPAFEIADELEKNNYSVKFSDPFVRNSELDLPNNIYEAASGKDILILTSDHGEYRELDLDRLKQSMNAKPLIVDARAVVDRKNALDKGFEYHGIGRL